MKLAPAGSVPPEFTMPMSISQPLGDRSLDGMDMPYCPQQPDAPEPANSVAEPRAAELPNAPVHVSAVGGVSTVTVGVTTALATWLKAQNDK